MTFKADAPSLVDEIESAVRYRNDHLRYMDELVEGYTGSAYRGSYHVEEGDNPENHAYEWVTYTVPQLVFGNPHVLTKTRRSNEPSEQVAQAIQAGLNRWVAETRMEELNEQLATDFGFCPAVALVSRVPQPGWRSIEDPANWPQAERIAPEDFVFDPQVKTLGHCRFMGHGIVRDKEDMLADAREDDSWNADAINDLAYTSPYETKEHVEQVHKEANYERVDRKQVYYYEMFVPRKELDWEALAKKYDWDEDVVSEDEGFNGCFFYVGLNEQGKSANQTKSRYLRDPQPWWGPRCGPYVIIGAHVVPSHAWALQPIVASKAQVDQLNDSTRSMLLAANAYKQLILVAGDDQKLQQAIKDGIDLFAYGLKDLDEIDKRVRQFAIGGITEQHVRVHEILRDLVDRNTGLPETRRGNLSSGTTATAVADAAQAAETRSRFIQKKFRDGIRQILWIVGWYLYYDDTVFFPLGDTVKDVTEEVVMPDGNVGQMPVDEPWFYGGSFPDEIGSYEDLELVIDLYSMSVPSEQREQVKVQAMLQGVGLFSQLMVAAPFVDWRPVIRMWAEANHLPGFEQFFDYQLAQQIAGLQMMAQTQREEEPQLGRQKASEPGGGTAWQAFMGNGFRPQGAGNGMGESLNPSTEKIKGLVSEPTSA